MTRLLITCLCLLATLGTKAQNIYFSHLTPADGLSQVSVNSLYADGDGQIWMATRAGLDCYNGNSIHVYSNNPSNPNPLFSNNVRLVTGDGRRMIYLVCSEGLVSLDTHTHRFTTLYRGGQSAICFGDALYMGTGNIVYRFSADNTRRNMHASLPQGQSIAALVYDSRRRLWIGTVAGGLYCLERGRLRHVVPDSHITTIYEDSRHNIWAGSWNDGLWTITPDGKATNTKAGGWLASNFVRTFCEDNMGNMWVGTYHGLVRYTPSTGEHRLFTADGQPGSLTNSSIWSIIKDHQGTLWIGTYFGGVNYVNPEYEIFTHYRTSKQKGSGLSFPVVGCMTEDNSHRLWISTEGGGLNVYDRKTRTFSKFDAIPTANIKALYYDTRRNTMWVGTHLDGLYRIDLATRHVSNYRHRRGDRNSLPDNIVRDITAVGDLIIVATQSGVAAMNPAPSGTTRFMQLLPKERLQAVPSLCLDRSGYLWIATEGNGAFRLNIHTARYDHYRHSPGNPSTISSNYIYNIMCDRRGHVWLSTASNNICLFNPAKGTFGSYGGCDGLSGDCVYAAAPSSMGNRDLLLITNRGFSILNTATHKFRNYDSSNGLPLATVNERALYVSRDGTVFVGGIDGMVSFYERDLHKRPTPYRLVFSQLYVNGKEIEPADESDILDNDLRYTPSITLAHDQTVFSIEYCTTNFIKANDLPVEFRLKGLSDKWIPARQKILSFSGLAAGNYTLELRCPGSDIPVASLSIRILPPWYASWWAYIIYMVCIAAAAWWLSREYRDRIRLAESLKFEQRRIHDIEEQNQSKLRFFTNVSHEIRTPLTVIISLAESLMRSATLSGEPRNKLLGIWRNSNQLRTLISELLDFRKQEQGHTHIHVRQADMAAFLRDAATMFKEYAANKDIMLRVDTQQPLDMWFDPKQMQKVASNLISNAIKHTPQGGTVTVEARTDDDGTQAVISVSDTGSGISPDDLPHVFGRFYQSHKIESIAEIGTGIGLNLTKGIVELHHGTISVDSQPGHGTTFTVTLPIARTAFTPDETDTLADTDTATAPVPPDNTQAPAYNTPDTPHADDNAPEVTHADDSSQEPSATERPTILIVEDNDDIRQLLATLFAPFYNTRTAVDGAEAMEMVTDEQPDIILSDVLMPHMSGIELCRAVKHDFSTCHIPVVLLTARTAVDQTLEGLKTGADDYVTKPFNNDILVSRCNNLVNTRRMLQRKFSEHPHHEADMLATNPMDKNLLDRAMQIIDRYYADSTFSVDTFAREIGMSRTAFFNKWKSLTGETPKGFILNLRLRKAADMLRARPDLSISEVSYANGFSSPRYFCKCFKDAYKVQPSAYRAATEA